MIAHLRGRLLFRDKNGVILEVQGTGYEVHVSIQTLYTLPPDGEETALWIHTYVREDQLQLFGFNTREERHLFQQLIRVSGIGPRIAMTLLSGLSVAEIDEAVARGNDAPFRAVPGIGPKVASRILLDLKGKRLIPEGSPLGTPAGRVYDEALSALLHLGYTSAQARKALEGLRWGETTDVREAVREGLKNLRAP